MEEQLPELVNSLEAVRHLKLNLNLKSEIETNFKLTEGVYKNCAIQNDGNICKKFSKNPLRILFLTNSGKVMLFIGANIALEYDLLEA